MQKNSFRLLLTLLVSLILLVGCGNSSTEGSSFPKCKLSLKDDPRYEEAEDISVSVSYSDTNDNSPMIFSVSAYYKFDTETGEYEIDKDTGEKIIYYSLEELELPTKNTYELTISVDK